MESAKTKIHPLDVEVRTEGGYQVRATAIEQRSLLEIAFGITANGCLLELDRKTLVEGLPVPYVVR
jgi:hypothetical protein